MVSTVFIPIIEVNYSGSGLNVVLTFFSFNAALKINQGNSSSMPTNFSTSLLDILFLLAVIFIIVTLIMVSIEKNKLGAVANALAILFLLILFLNYFVVGSLNGQILSGITISITDGFEYYLILISMIFLLISSFTKFQVKPAK